MRNLYVLFIVIVLGGSGLYLLNYFRKDQNHLDRAALPNILLIISDDQRYDDLDPFMPVTRKKIFDTGAEFTNAYVTTPACCPSRASIFTGRYASEHRVTGNRFRLKEKTFIEDIHSTGKYYTGLVGKYLNTWDGTHRPEFNYWASFAGGSAPYYNPPLNVNGVWTRTKGYITHLLRDYALDFLDQAAHQQKPFLLVLAVNTPHAPAIPFNKDTKRFAGYKKPLPPNFNHRSRTDKPYWLQRRKLLPERAVSTLSNFRRKQWQCLYSLDQAVEKIMNKLTEIDQLDNTAIFYLSDNGLLLGEHTLKSKDAVYEAAIKVPFGLHYPPLIAPQTRKELVANIDIAPTIYDLAQIPIPIRVSGHSLLGLFNATSPPWREELLIEGYRTQRNRRPFIAIHTPRFVLIKNQRFSRNFDPHRFELYDLAVDPFQLNNRFRSGQYRDTRADLLLRFTNLIDRHRENTLLKRPKGIKGKTKFGNPFKNLRVKSSL